MLLQAANEVVEDMLDVLPGWQDLLLEEVPFGGQQPVLLFQMLYLHSESKATFFRHMLRCIVWGSDKCGGTSSLSQRFRGSLWFEEDERTKEGH